jgi:penicillin-binding protein 1B
MRKKVIFTFVFLICASMMFAASYIYILTREAKQLMEIDPIVDINQVFNNITIEEGSVFKDSYLELLYSLSSIPQTYNVWKTEKIENQKILSLKKDELYTSEFIDLKLQYKNSCDEKYCLQFKAPFEKIPLAVLKGLIGIEDYRFLSHVGIDLKSILRAIIVDLREMKFAQGGSTITQQMVKNKYLSNEKNFKRKFKELIYSFMIERRYTKEEILAVYLNESYWGSIDQVKIKGISTAAIVYFQKRPEFLDPYEISILVSMLKGPHYFHPLYQTERLRLRSNVVFDKLQELNLLTKDPLLKWSDKKWLDWNARLKSLLNDRKAYSLWEAFNSDNRNLNIYETFALLAGKNRFFQQSSEKIKESDVAVKIFIGSPFCQEPCEFFEYYSKFERDNIKAIREEKHQIGSLLKPIIFDFFLKNGYRPDSVISNEKISLKLKSGLWTPGESSLLDKPEISLLEALQKSRNRPMIKLAFDIGIDKLEKYLLDYLPTLSRPLGEYPAQLIGSIELSMYEIYLMYAKFIKNECQNHSSSVSDLNLDDETKNQSVLFLLSDPNQTTIKNTVDERLQKLRFFGKTGTSNNGFDNWFVAFDGKELYIIWVGLESGRKDKKLALAGSSSAFKIFQDYISFRGKQINEFECYNAVSQ